MKSSQEQCDDGNAAAKDGCGPDCRIEWKMFGIWEWDACGVDLSGHVLCIEPEGWGRATKIPQLPGPARSIAFGQQSCVVLEDGRAVCWERLSNEPENVRTLQFGPGGRAESIECGFGHCCSLIEDGGVRCWGDNSTDQVLHDRRGGLAWIADPYEEPLGLSRVIRARQVAAGLHHSCAVLSDGTVKCWGRGEEAQLGIGILALPHPPTAVRGLGGKAIAVSAGEAHSCALLEDGAAKCWGSNFSCQLGRAPDSRTNPKKGIQSVIFPRNQGCEVGDGSFRPCAKSPLRTPVDLGAGKAAKAIVSTADYTCVLLDDVSLKCWGGGSWSYSEEDAKNLPREFRLGLKETHRIAKLVPSRGCPFVLMDDATLRCLCSKCPLGTSTQN